MSISVLLGLKTPSSRDVTVECCAAVCRLGYLRGVAIVLNAINLCISRCAKSPTDFVCDDSTAACYASALDHQIALQFVIAGHSMAGVITKHFLNQHSILCAKSGIGFHLRLLLWRHGLTAHHESRCSQRQCFYNCSFHISLLAELVAPSMA